MQNSVVKISLTWASLCLLTSTIIGETNEIESYSNTVYQIKPVGVVHNIKGEPVRLEIYNQYIEGLQGLDDCSHVTVLWWFHKNDTPENRRILKVHPRGNKENPITGVFATHSPVRPNLLAMTTCKIISVKDNIVIIDQIDAFDNTPILDLKSAGTRKTPLKEPQQEADK